MYRLTGTEGKHGGTVGSRVKDTDGSEGLPVVEREVGPLADAEDPLGDHEEATHEELPEHHG